MAYISNKDNVKSTTPNRLNNLNHLKYGHEIDYLKEHYIENHRERKKWRMDQAY